MGLPKPYYDDAGITLYHGDCLQLLVEGSWSAQSVDCIVTDPPYWTLDRWREVGTTTRLGGHNDPDKRSGWFNTISQDELWEFMCEAARILKPKTHAYIMGDGQVLRWLLGYAEEAGFSNCKPVVWDKVNQGMGYHYRCRHEYFVMLDKGKNRRLNSLSTPDVWTVKTIRTDFPTEKPVDLMEIPISHSTAEGEIVLDPFCGSGSTLIAAQRLGRKAVGIEIDEKSCEVAAGRLRKEAESSTRTLF